MALDAAPVSAPVYLDVARRPVRLRRSPRPRPAGAPRRPRPLLFSAVLRSSSASWARGRDCARRSGWVSAKGVSDSTAAVAPGGCPPPRRCVCGPAGGCACGARGDGPGAERARRRGAARGGDPVQRARRAAPQHARGAGCSRPAGRSRRRPGRARRSVAVSRDALAARARRLHSRLARPVRRRRSRDPRRPCVHGRRCGRGGRAIRTHGAERSGVEAARTLDGRARRRAPPRCPRRGPLLGVGAAQGIEGNGGSRGSGRGDRGDAGSRPAGGPARGPAPARWRRSRRS